MNANNNNSSADITTALYNNLDRSEKDIPVKDAGKKRGAPAGNRNRVGHKKPGIAVRGEFFLNKDDVILFEEWCHYYTPDIQITPELFRKMCRDIIEERKLQMRKELEAAINLKNAPSKH